jgi:hypothetical protein
MSGNMKTQGNQTIHATLVNPTFDLDNLDSQANAEPIITTNNQAIRFCGAVTTVDQVENDDGTFTIVITDGPDCTELTPVPAAGEDQEAHCDAWLEFIDDCKIKWKVFEKAKTKLQEAAS